MTLLVMTNVPMVTFWYRVKSKTKESLLKTMVTMNLPIIIPEVQHNF